MSHLVRVSMVVAALAASSSGLGADRVQLQFDTSQAKAVVTIARESVGGRPVPPQMWEALFASAPYQHLKQRQAGSLSPISDAAFQAFVGSETVVTQVDALARTVVAWSRVDLNDIARRVLSYLPPTATVSAIVCPVIKPASNSFVWKAPGDAAPTIFVYVNPSLTTSQFANKIAHESHHIGVDSLEAAQDGLWAALPASTKRAARWLGGFGEGEAMLAAAGSPDVHPHALDGPDAEAQWDRDMAHFNQDVETLQAFFFDILDGRLAKPAAIAQRAQPFYGTQGAWYTVGYRMAAMVERHFGRAALVGAILDPRQLLALYNRAAAESNAQLGADLRLWSPDLLARLAGS